MNERGVGVLVAAGLSGRRQIRGRLWDNAGGVCAMGLFVETIRDALGIARRDVWDDGPRLYRAVRCAYGIDEAEWNAVVALNNTGVDFIGIARKLGPDASGASPEPASGDDA